MSISSSSLLYFIFLHFYILQLCNAKQPNIVIIIGDDMGWNDVGFHGNNALKTPNIDALAYNGIILNRHYALQTCTPSRAALLTGQYPIRLGYQGFPILSGENRVLPEDAQTLAEQLKTLGYTNHLVGKWHLGYGYKNNTPMMKGFDTHFGHYNGFIGYYNYLSLSFNGLIGKDIHDGYEHAEDYIGKYCTDVYTQKAEELIDKQSDNKPFFLIVAHHASHTGWDNNELGVRNELDNYLEFSHIDDNRRKLYAGVMKAFDESIGRIVVALSRKKVLDNTIILVLSDNGGPTVDTMANTASNWPFRGLKQSLNEGGVRVFAVVWSKLFLNNIVRNDLFHITDWYPTLYAAAGGNVEKLGKIDGINHWDALVTNKKTRREELLLNIDEVENQSGIIGFNGTYKLLTVAKRENFHNYHSTSEENSTRGYSNGDILNSLVNRELRRQALRPLNEQLIDDIRREATIENCRINNPTDNLTMALFNLDLDPCETTNIANDNVDVVNYLKMKLESYKSELVPQLRAAVDPCSNPIYFNNYWHTWLSDPHNLSNKEKEGEVQVPIGIEGRAASCKFTNFILIICLFLFNFYCIFSSIKDR